MFDALIHNKVMMAGLALLVTLGAWYSLSGSGAVKEGLVTESFTSPTSAAERDLVATLLQLRTVTLDGTVFSDPAFQSLRDFGSQIVSEPVGRPNPFAPLVPTTSGTSTLGSSTPRITR